MKYFLSRESRLSIMLKQLCDQTRFGVITSLAQSISTISSTMKEKLPSMPFTSTQQRCRPQVPTNKRSQTVLQAHSITLQKYSSFTKKLLRSHICLDPIRGYHQHMTVLRLILIISRSVAKRTTQKGARFDYLFTGDKVSL